MGNSPSTGGLRPGNADYSSTTRIGESVEVEFKGRKVDEGEEGEIRESWSIVYKCNAGNMCSLSLSKRSRNRNTMSSSTHPDDELRINFDDSKYWYLTLQRDATTGLLNYRTCILLSRRGEEFSNVATNAYGEITNTHLRILRGEKTKSLVVEEYKRKSKDEYHLYSVTVAHYYCVNGEDGKGGVGLSVAVKRIRLLNNGKFDFCVDGPEQHPVDDLAYMFDHVLKTRTWKPTDCPHCANKYILDRQSDSDSELDNVTQPMFHGRRPNPSTLVSNPGIFRGNYSGSTFINRFYGRRPR